MNNTTVIIPAAGLATRMRPLSSNMSKAMIPVCGKPIISYIIDELLKYDSVNEIIIVENKLHDISEFVKSTYSFVENTFKFVEQKNPKGPLHAIEVGWKKSTKKDNSILVWLGDTICRDKLNFDSPGFLGVSKIEQKSRWCLVDSDGKTFYDKPDTDVPTDSALIGLYYFNDRKWFNDSIKKGMNKPQHKGEHQIAALLSEYLTYIPKFELLDTKEWYDCGELKTYYESTARLMQGSSREFNTLEIDTFLGTITKKATGDKALKIEKEKTWFSTLSDTQRLFVPQILESQHGEMKMSWEAGTPLNEVWLYERMNADTWIGVTNSVLDIYHKVFYNSGKERLADCYEMYIQKNMDRLDSDMYSDFVAKDTAKNFIKSSGLRLLKTTKWSNRIHGDLHLGNMLFNSHNGRIKLLDPRGHFGMSEFSGDSQYDMGKLMHDWYCGYMMILSGRYHIEGSDVILHWDEEKRNKILVNMLIKMKGYGYDVENIKRLSIMLFLTCIPFHQDNPERCRAFWLRAMNLIYREFRNEK